MHKKHAFTLVEAVISVSILIVLSAVSFYQFVWSMTDARNASRIADIWNTKTHLKNLKIKNGGYPVPKNSFSITNSGSKIIQQWILPENVSLWNNTIPIDPLTNNNYLYSTLTTNLRFQIGASLEDTQESNQIGWKAYVDGDFEKVSQISDGLLFATSTGWEINTLSGKIILKNSTYNLPYDGKWAMYSAGVSYSNVISAKDIVQEKSNSYFSCNEILKQWYNLWNGVYTITPKKSNTPFNVYCDMTSDGGGWTLVATIDGSKNDHINTGATNANNIWDRITFWKFSDTDINNIVTKHYRLNNKNNINSRHLWLDSNCVFWANKDPTLENGCLTVSNGWAYAAGRYWLCHKDGSVSNDTYVYAYNLALWPWSNGSFFPTSANFSTYLFVK